MNLYKIKVAIDSEGDGNEESEVFYTLSALPMEKIHDKAREKLFLGEESRITKIKDLGPVLDLDGVLDKSSHSYEYQEACCLIADNLVEFLNCLGKDGWKLVGTPWNNGNAVHMLLTRRHVAERSS